MRIPSDGRTLKVVLYQAISLAVMAAAPRVHEGRHGHVCEARPDHRSSRIGWPVLPGAAELPRYLRDPVSGVHPGAIHRAALRRDRAGEGGVRKRVVPTG